jgi:predicted DCC family thiol-disulfide oxidoreductase YuxK
MTSDNTHGDNSTHPLILFDGLCGLCNRTVNFVIDRDPNAHFHFAPLQSPLAARLLSQHPNAYADLSSVVLIDDGKIYLRSCAALRILRQLSGPVSFLCWAIILPQPLRDWAYDWIARNRYKWFGKLDACRLPHADMAGRFRFD